MHTWTDYNVSVLHKLFIALTLNSVGLIILVNRGTSVDNWYEPSGLLNDVSTLILSMGLTSFLVPLFSPAYLAKLLGKCRARAQHADGNLLMSQGEANQ